MDNTLEQIFTDSETMLAMISHDLKTPINASIMAINLLADKKLSPLNPYQKEILENVMGSMKYSKTLVENILDRYRFNNNTFILNKTQINFVDVVNSVIEESKYLFVEKGQKLKIISDIKESFTEIDLMEITRVINNLLANASKYAPKKSTVIIRIFDNKRFVFFSIENQGKCKVNPFKIFEKFVTASDNSKTISTGLGLYIVKRIINAHGGKVFAETDDVVRVTFSLPKIIHLMH